MLHERRPQPRLLEEPDQAHDGHRKRHDAEVGRAEQTGQRDRDDEPDRHADVVDAGRPPHPRAHGVGQRPGRAAHAGRSRKRAGRAPRIRWAAVRVTTARSLHTVRRSRYARLSASFCGSTVSA